MNSSLTLYFDGNCPLCLVEIKQLQKLNSKATLSFVDLNDEHFCSDFPHIDKAAALAKMHGETQSGEMIYGLDVTVAAWSAVGKHRWLQVLRWPILRYVADFGYWLFARYRSQIAYLLMGRNHSPCTSDKCSTLKNSEANPS